MSPMAPPIPKRVLIVEDDDDMRQLLEDYLASAGFTTSSAATVGEALERLQGVPFDVVVSDLSLPGASGLSLLRIVRGRGPRPKVIIITAFGDMRSYSDAMTMGASEYMSKPFRMEELVDKIRSALAA